MKLQLQRLARPSYGVAPVMLDVGAILRGVSETAPGPVAWGDIYGALLRAGRRALWVVAPTAASCSVLTAADLNAAEAELNALLPAGSVLRSTQPLVGLIASRQPSGLAFPRLLLVTAGVEAHAYELRVLDRWVDVVVDIVTGKAWTPQRAEEEFGAPDILPMLYAATGREPAERPVVRFAREPRYYEAIRSALEKTRSLGGADLPARVKKELAARYGALAAQAELLSGNRRRDVHARSKLSLWLHEGAYSAPSGSAYIAARTEERGGRLRFAEVQVLEGTTRTVAAGHAKAVRLLGRLRSRRWFAPRALDLLAAAADARVPLPERAVDPALAAFVLDPDYPKPLEVLFEPLAALSTKQRQWLNDLKRREIDATSLADLLSFLPDLDQELASSLGSAHVLDVFENDLSATLPVLAKIERRGALVGHPKLFNSWPVLERVVLARAATLTQRLAGVFKYDLARASWDDVQQCLVRRQGLPKPYWHPSLRSEAFVHRLAAQGMTEAKAVLELRSITSDSGLLYWLHVLGRGGRPPDVLRGRHVPQRTGRWGMADHPLQNIPKRSAGGLSLRSGLRAPPGHVLIRADWNAFEGRLVAELSQDPTLLAAARAKDLHTALGNQLNVSRSNAKSMVYALLFGQQQNGFLGANPELSTADAAMLYTKAQSALAVALGYLDNEVKKRASGQWLMTPGGFRRMPDEAGQARNFVVQGFGADCIRWVLRQLDVRLEAVGARVIHQAHDEVLVAVVGEQAPAAKAVMTQVMERDLVQQSGLFSHGVPMYVKLVERKTW